MASAPRSAVWSTKRALREQLAGMASALEELASAVPPLVPAVPPEEPVVPPDEPVLPAIWRERLQRLFAVAGPAPEARSSAPAPDPVRRKRRWRTGVQG